MRIIPNRLLSTSPASVPPRAESPMRSRDTAAAAAAAAAAPSASGSGSGSVGLDAILGLALKVVIIKARDLAAKDRGGTSDPYLVLTLGDARVATHSVPKTLNPEWNVIEQLPVNSDQSLVLDVICWDKDRFGKDYLGEFDLALEEIFQNEKPEQEPRWYPLRSKRPGKKTSVVSGEVLLQFSLIDTTNPSIPPRQLFDKLSSLTGALPVGLGLGLGLGLGSSSSRNVTPVATPLLTPGVARSATSSSMQDGSVDGDDEEDLDLTDQFDDDGALDDLAEDLSKVDTAEKRRRRLRIKGLKKKRRENPYAFTNGGSDTVGIIYLEIAKIIDLPPESNLTRTGFDMDPFVVASLGKKTYRTRRVRHNLNPVFNEKMIFTVQSHEQSYSFAFTVIDHDKYSGNDFIASCNLSVQSLIEKAPKANPETGLYELRDPPEQAPAASRKRLTKIGVSRSSSSSSLAKILRSQQAPKAGSGSTSATGAAGAAGAAISSTPPSDSSMSQAAGALQVPGEGIATPLLPSDLAVEPSPDAEDPDFIDYVIPLRMKNLDKWESKHTPIIFLRAKYMPYTALRQQFWRAMLRQYDTDDSGVVSRIELCTMLDTLGSTLKDSTIDSFFLRFPHKASDNEESWELTFDEAVLCLEDQLQSKGRPPPPPPQQAAAAAALDKTRTAYTSCTSYTSDPRGLGICQRSGESSEQQSAAEVSGSSTPQIMLDLPAGAEIVAPVGAGAGSDILAEAGGSSPGGDGDGDDRGEDSSYFEKEDKDKEEHVVEIRECPICHQPRLNKRSDGDIITHIATCASQDWRQVNTVLMSGFVTASQAQRKWYSKVITKISYGGYKLGANSANILVQDRITGQITEEKMSVYVRLGIRLLYKGLKSRDMENKRIRKMLKNLSIKQGKKFDNPTSREEIDKFIEFHRLDMSEVLLPVDAFRNFNEFFYRALKPGARPCSAPDRPGIVVSPADCRSVVFNHITQATNIWVKGREFNMKRLLGDAYPDDAARFEGGALGIFRLAPQDYHRFHIPVDGTMGEPRTIAGEYYTVNPMAIRSALDVYGENVRVLVPIDSEVHGRVMVVCVGAMMVGSTVITREAGERVRRAEELGYFKFGGSTVLLLFEPGKMRFDDDLVDNSNGALETLIRVGMSVGRLPNQPQWMPDMRKNEQDITEEEKRQAMRRIQGSIAMESPDDSAEDYGRGRLPSVSTLAASAT